MGMVLCLRTVSDSTLEALFRDPESVLSMLEAEEEEENGALTDEGLMADLDKSWHAIHYLLTGSAQEGSGPTAFLLAGGRQIGDVEVGYGPARGFTSAEVRDIASRLAALPWGSLASRYDGAQMDRSDVYPTIWARDGQDGLNYIGEYYEQLREFMATASHKHMGMLVYLS